MEPLVARLTKGHRFLPIFWQTVIAVQMDILNLHCSFRQWEYDVALGAAWWSCHSLSDRYNNICNALLHPWPLTSNNMTVTLKKNYSRFITLITSSHTYSFLVLTLLRVLSRPKWLSSTPSWHARIILFFSSVVISTLCRLIVPHRASVALWYRTPWLTSNEAACCWSARLSLVVNSVG